MIRFLRSAFVPCLGILIVIVPRTWATSARAAGAPQHDDASQLARAILESAGVDGGLVVHLGCGDGKLTAALRANDRYLVHGLDADGRNVARAREHLRARGLLGEVSVDRAAQAGLPYADNVVNLLVAEEPGGSAPGEVMRVVCPGGVALVREAGGAEGAGVGEAVAAGDRS